MDLKQALRIAMDSVETRQEQVGEPDGEYVEEDYRDAYRLLEELYTLVYMPERP